MKAKRRKSKPKKALRGRKIGLRASDNDRRLPRRRDWMPGEEMYKPIKKPVTLRLDADILAWFKRHGQGYQTRINQALRAMMVKERKAGG